MNQNVEGKEVNIGEEGGYYYYFTTTNKRSERIKVKMRERMFSLAAALLFLLISIITIPHRILADGDFSDQNVTPTAYTCYQCFDVVADDSGNMYALGASSDVSSIHLYIYPENSNTATIIALPGITDSNTFNTIGAIALYDGYVYIPGFTKTPSGYNAALYVFPVGATELSDGALHNLELIWNSNGFTGANNIFGIVVDADRIYIGAPNAANPALMIFDKAINPLESPPSFVTKASLRPSQFRNFDSISSGVFFPSGMRFANDGTNRILIGTGGSNAALLLTIDSFSNPTMTYNQDFAGVFISFPGDLSSATGKSVVSDINGNFYFTKDLPSLYSLDSDGATLNRYNILEARGISSVFFKQTTTSNDNYNVYIADRNADKFYRLDALVSAVHSGDGVGDPQFHGFAGQSFQVHGVDGSIYSIISDKLLQVNARFDYLDHGVCPSHSSEANCWSHPGSYFGLLTFQTNNGDRLRIAAGPAADGFESIVFNGKSVDFSRNFYAPASASDDLAISASPSSSGSSHSTSSSLATGVFIPGKSGENQMYVYVLDKYRLTVKAGIFSFKIENSDNFVNILSVNVQNGIRLVNELRSHGILGQTWRLLKGDRCGDDVPEIEGSVPDYANSNNNEWGHDTTYNKFTAY